MEVTQVGTPFERIGIDVLGPFPRSRNGNTNIIAAVDYLTKWVEVRAVPDATARQIGFFKGSSSSSSRKSFSDTASRVK